MYMVSLKTRTNSHVFLQAIQIRNMAPLYAIICAGTLSVQVTCAESKRTTSFTSQALRKCQVQFKTDQARRANSAKKRTEINSCVNPVIRFATLVRYVSADSNCRVREFPTFSESPIKTLRTYIICVLKIDFAIH